MNKGVYSKTIKLEQRMNSAVNTNTSSSHSLVNRVSFATSFLNAVTISAAHNILYKDKSLQPNDSTLRL